MQIHLFIPVIPIELIFVYCVGSFLFSMVFGMINEAEQRKWYGWQIALRGLLWPITIPCMEGG